MRLAIFTHVIHQNQNGRYFAYSPYVREINIWLKYVDEVEVVGPAPLPIGIGAEGEKQLQGLYYEHSNLSLTTVPSFDLLNKPSILKAVFKIPKILLRMIGAMRRADHLHLRCPGNVGLLACICQIFFPLKPKTAKYAGNWDPMAKQPWTYKLQKWILSNTFLTRNMTVLVYGNWPNQSKNILPFFTASFSENEIETIEKKIKAPYKFLYVGNLVPGKQPEVALQIVESLVSKNIPAELHVYGNGEMMGAIKDQTNNKDYIHLHGNQSLEVLKQAYKESHFLILASKSEGWPKVMAEAMFFGCIPVVTNVSCVSWMINYGSRGILIPDVRVESGKWKVDSQHVGKKVESEDPPLRFGQGGHPPASGSRAGHAPSGRAGGSLPHPVGAGEDSQDGLGKVDGGLLDTFQKRRQFECFPDSPKGERGNLSRTGFSETLEVTESGNLIDDTIGKIIELINNPEEMKRMSIEAQEWSQQYTLERFEDAIKEVLSNKSSSPFGRGGGEG